MSLSQTFTPILTFLKVRKMKSWRWSPTISQNYSIIRTKPNPHVSLSLPPTTKSQSLLFYELRGYFYRHSYLFTPPRITKSQSVEMFVDRRLKIFREWSRENYLIEILDIVTLFRLSHKSHSSVVWKMNGSKKAHLYSSWKGTNVLHCVMKTPH